MSVIGEVEYKQHIAEYKIGMAPGTAESNRIAQENLNLNREKFTREGDLAFQGKLAKTKENATPKPLTESQGNAVAFGMRMAEANKILNDLEKAGIKDTGKIRAEKLMDLVP